MDRALWKLFRTTFLAALMVFLATPAQAQDVVRLGAVKGRAGMTVEVPVYVCDVRRTPLGLDRPAGQRIQGLSLKVSYSPAEAVSSVTVSRDGITSSLHPLFESKGASGNTAIFLGSFDEKTNLLPFQRFCPKGGLGDRVATLSVKIAPDVSPGTTITLTLDPSVTSLVNQAGTKIESRENGRLVLVNGSIKITGKKR